MFGGGNLEIIGETGEPSCFMKIQYCGGWGYRPHCITLKNKLDELMPDNKIQFQLAADPGVTGNFECTLFNDPGLTDGETAVFSKQAKGCFPFQKEEEMVEVCNILSEKLKKWDTGAQIP